jgi:hypothetical protein
MALMINHLARDVKLEKAVAGTSLRQAQTRQMKALLSRRPAEGEARLLIILAAKSCDGRLEDEGAHDKPSGPLPARY